MVLPNPAAKLINHQRCRNQRYCDETQYRVSPTKTKGLVHCRASQRKESAKEGTRDCESRDARGSKCGEGIDGIRLYGNEDTHHAEAKWNKAYHGNDPLEFD